MTRLVVDALDGSSASLAGLFQPAQHTKAGCQCSQLWPYTYANGTSILVPGTCINPTNAPGCAFTPARTRAACFCRGPQQGARQQRGWGEQLCNR
jgi:hypothetical protein